MSGQGFPQGRKLSILCCFTKGLSSLSQSGTEPSPPDSIPLLSHLRTPLCSTAALSQVFERSCLPQECCCFWALVIRKAVAWKMQVQQRNTHTFWCTNWCLCCQSWEQPSQRDFVMKNCAGAHGELLLESVLSLFSFEDHESSEKYFLWL